MTIADPVSIIEVPLERVVPLRVQYLFDGNRTFDEVIDERDGPTARHWVAVKSGVDVGCATLALDTQTVAGQVSHHRLRWLGVHPDHQRQGIAARLIRTRLQVVADGGAEWAWASARLTALPTYLNLGAVPDHREYLDDGTITHVNVLYGPLPGLLRQFPSV